MRPSKVSASLRLKLNAALLTTLPVRLPVVPPAPICNVPALMVVPPVCVLAPVSAVVPVPACVTVPVPLIAPGTVRVSVRLKLKAALLTMFPVRLPAVPPAPICSVPAEMVTPPAALLSPVREVVPVPAWVRIPVPRIAPAMVTASLRFKITSALLVMLPVTLPLVPPAPIWNLPLLTVVPPL